MKKFTEDQMVNFKAAMERINAIDSSIFDEVKNGARVAKDHMIKTLTYLIKNKEVNEINAILLDYGLTENDINNPAKIMEAIKELDSYQLELMGEYLDMTNPNIVEFFSYIKDLTKEFEAELETSISVA